MKLTLRHCARARGLRLAIQPYVWRHVAFAGARPGARDRPSANYWALALCARAAAPLRRHLAQSHAPNWLQPPSAAPDALSESWSHMDSVGAIISTARAIATPQSEILLTTLMMDQERTQLEMLKQWAGHLGPRLRNAMLVGTDRHTCAVLRNHSLPCVTDSTAPAVHGEQQGFGRQVTLKWWYAMILSRAGLNLVFSDADVVWLKDPFLHWDRSYDLQGLADIRSPNLTVQAHHRIECIDAWMDGTYGALGSVYPCQSTGLWYSRSTLATNAFLEGLNRFLLTHPDVWEQKAFQLLVVRYLIGLEDRLPPLRYRLLATSRFINIGYYEERLQKGLGVEDMVAVHCGYLNRMTLKFEALTQAARLPKRTRHARHEGATLALTI